MCTDESPNRAENESACRGVGTLVKRRTTIFGESQKCGYPCRNAGLATNKYGDGSGLVTLGTQHVVKLDARKPEVKGSISLIPKTKGKKRGEDDHVLR